MKAQQKVLFLTLHTFSLTGGIEKVNRALTKVLDNITKDFKIGSYQSLSMYDNKVDEAYGKATNFRGFRGKRVSFALSALKKGISADLVILSHINLLIFAKLIKKINPKARIALMAHGIEVWRDLPNWKIKFLSQCEIWAVSRFTAKKMSDRYHIPSQNIHILNNCLDPYFTIPTSFEPSETLLAKYQLQPTQAIIYTLARLSSTEQYKGYDEVIKSMVEVIKVLPNAHYLLAGKADVMEHQRLSTLIKSLDLEKHVTLAGFIADEEVQTHYTSATVFAMPSTGEGFGISFIEAAACGSPVIGGNLDGSTDALLDGKLGKLINPTADGELSKAIIDQILTVKTVESAQKLQQTCLAHFSFDRYQQNVVKLLNLPA